MNIATICDRCGTHWTCPPQALEHADCSDDDCSGKLRRRRRGDTFEYAFLLGLSRLHRERELAKLFGMFDDSSEIGQQVRRAQETIRRNGMAKKVTEERQEQHTPTRRRKRGVGGTVERQEQHTPTRRRKRGVGGTVKTKKKKKVSQTLGPLTLTVNLGRFSVGTSTCGVRATVPRNQMTLSRADQYLTNRRFSVRVILNPPNEQQSLDFAEDESETLECTMDVKNYSTTHQAYAFGCSFAKGDVPPEFGFSLSNAKGVRLEILEAIDLEQAEEEAAHAEL